MISFFTQYAHGARFTKTKKWNEEKRSAMLHSPFRLSPVAPHVDFTGHRLQAAPCRTKVAATEKIVMIELMVGIIKWFPVEESFIFRNQGAISVPE
mmetsp:Transcript_13490/g.26897  ORF Transcript_13490/g.26897 Transcript_13490/m.26897 type:complete len:96 (-) Transcript_13490:987-1274(-)